MKRSVTVAATATAIVVVGLSGCSSNKSSTSSSGSSTAAAAGSSGTSVAKVTIDGKDQNVQGTVACTSAAGNVNIAIGGASTGIGVVLTDAQPARGEVRRAGQRQRGDPWLHPGHRHQGNATATKDGSKYKISSTATGVDMANPMQPVRQALRNRCDLPLVRRS